MRRSRAAAAASAALGWAVAASAASAAEAAEVAGLWETQSGNAHVRIAPCAEGLCGEIVWLKEPLDEQGQPKRDRNNADETLRDRSILGLPMLRGFQPAGPARWEDGRIYNPEDGETYRAKLHLAEPDRLSVSGCVLVFCKTQIWRRVE